MKMFDADKTRMIGLRTVKNYDNMLSRFHPIPESYGQTDGRTDIIPISISRVSVLTRDNDNWFMYTKLLYFLFMFISVTRNISSIQYIQHSRNICDYVK